MEPIGKHLVADFWGAKSLSEIALLEAAMREAVNAAGATLLHLHLHPFGEGQGVTGAAVLSESHITVHTWPEHEFAALDIFMCGDSDPYAAIDVLRVHLQPRRLATRAIQRG